MGKLLDRRNGVCFLVPVITHLPMNPPRLFPLTGLVLATGILTTPLFAVVSIDYASIGNTGNANDASG